MKAIAIEQAIVQQIAVILNDTFGLSSRARCVDKKSKLIGRD